MATRDEQARNAGHVLYGSMTHSNVSTNSTHNTSHVSTHDGYSLYSIYLLYTYIYTDIISHIKFFSYQLHSIELKSLYNR